MKIVSAIVNQPPTFGRYMLFHIGDASFSDIKAGRETGDYMESGSLPMMRVATVEWMKKENDQASEYRILDRMTGSWIIPQPLIEKREEEDYRTQQEIQQSDIPDWIKNARRQAGFDDYEEFNGIFDQHKK